MKCILSQTGVEATAILRARGFANLIIALTANVVDDDITTFLSAGVDAVLIKPLKPAVVDQIMKYMENNTCRSVIGTGMRLGFTAERTSQFPCN